MFKVRLPFPHAVCDVTLLFDQAHVGRAVRKKKWPPILCLCAIYLSLLFYVNMRTWPHMATLLHGEADSCRFRVDPNSLANALFRWITHVPYSLFHHQPTQIKINATQCLLDGVSLKERDIVMYR